jgi:uncharacterized SAM-binding protein YcdF (DUF218 family)
VRAALKLLFAPGSLSLLVIALLAGFAVRRRGGRAARAARVWIAAWAILYVLLSLPVVARALHAGLTSGARPVLAAREAPAAGAVVVLGGGAVWHRLGDRDRPVMSAATSLRIAEAARVYHVLGSPIVIVSGRAAAHGDAPEVEAMREGLAAAGVPPDRIVIDDASVSTRGSAVNVGALLQARGIAQPVLVTSAIHMPRAARAFRAEGVTVVPSPAPPGLRARGRVTGAMGPRAFVPGIGALGRSEEALHEYAGLLYYWMRGWA